MLWHNNRYVFLFYFSPKTLPLCCLALLNSISNKAKSQVSFGNDSKTLLFSSVCKKVLDKQAVASPLSFLATACYACFNKYKLGAEENYSVLSRYMRYALALVYTLVFVFPSFMSPFYFRTASVSSRVTLSFISQISLLLCMSLLYLQLGITFSILFPLNISLYFLCFLILLCGLSYLEVR